ncbi:hypothetical protein JKF63_01395 [Porcisia hertigi]|uniref:Uncharacterized protein n=1 Tax=Porcisia hertigi TaxID=2761500 RepID=A0A836L3A0_9TRYP|nr:hypothetical protein JKF63_01395 [Porcisia hertigi]
MLRRTVLVRRYPFNKRGPRERKSWKHHVLTEPPKPVEWRDPKVWTKDLSQMKSFDAPQWDLWLNRARSQDMDEALQPFMDMPQSLKDRRYDIPWWANPFGAWYLQNVLSVELMKLPGRTNAEKIAIYRGRKNPPTWDKSKEGVMDDEVLLKQVVKERWRTLEFGDRDAGYPCTFSDYIQFLNEWFKSLDEEGLQRLREHFDRKIRPLLAVMSHVDLMWLESLTQNSVQNKEQLERRIGFQTSLGTPEFFDMSKRLRYEINEDYKVRDELGPELFALWSKAPERWPPERLAKMYGLDFTLVRKILVWHHFKACYDACVEPDWSLPKRLFALEWIRDVRARKQGLFYGKLRFAEQKITFYSDKFLFRDLVNRREASYANVWEMDDPYRFLQTEQDYEDYWGDNYDVYRRMFPEMIGKTGEPVQQYSQMPVWAGPHRDHANKSEHNWMFAEIGVNVGHEPLKKLELDPTNEKRRRFVIRQPDGSLRSAKMSEMRAWYWKEEWADFRFWAPQMEWGVENTPSMEQYQEHVPDTPDADYRKQRRIQSRPVKWFYESHYSRSGNFAGFQPLRFMQRRTQREVRWPDVVNAAVQIEKSKPSSYVFKAIPEM